MIPCLPRPLAVTLFPLVAASLLVSCGGSDSLDGLEIDVPFTTVLETQNSGVNSAEQVNLTTGSAFNDLWNRVVAGTSAPQVDFSAVQVLGVFLGSRSSACYRVTITRITRSASRLTVRFRETRPAAGDTCATVVVTPAHLVATARSSLPVSFVGE